MIFEVTPEQIEQLSDTDLRILIGYLAEQEVIKHGLSAVGVTYGGHQNAADAGIDVDVNLGEAEIEGYIPRALTGFQVKAENMARSDILKEMKPKGALRTSIANLGKMGGAYVIVSSKDNLSKPSLSRRKNAMAEAISGVSDAASLHLDFYDRRRIATWVNSHPGLIPWVRSKVGQPLSGWRPFEDWSSSPGPANEPYFTDDEVRLVGVRLKEKNGLEIAGGIQKIRGILSEPKGAVRLVGLSGVGKTRFVQALFDSAIGENNLSPQLAVYTDLSDNPDPVPLELLDYLHHLDQRCVLIVDNCGLELHRKLRARINSADSKVSLITVEYDISDDEPENTDVFKLEPASGKIIEKIVERRYPKLSQPEVGTIVEFSEGNSRVALALAETAVDGESLANLNDSELFKRLFRQNHEDNPALLRAAKSCALVYSFDGETLDGDESELEVLASLAGQPTSELYGHVSELSRRQLVQKRSKWRAVLPHALAHRLAKQALQDIPKATVIEHFTSKASVRLIKSFSRRLGYLHDLDEAQAIVSEWLKDDGWLSCLESFNDLGITVFTNIAPVNPEATLDSIKTAGVRNADFFGNDNKHRQRFVSILRAIAYECAYFEEAVEEIRKFAVRSEKTNNSGDAANVFNSLFHIYLSGTMASAGQRIKVLEKLVQSESEADHTLLYSGLDAMLECSHFMSSYSFEFGARKRSYGYYPVSGEEIKNWYREVLRLCSGLEKVDAHKTKIRNMIASQFRFLVKNTGLVDEFIALADEFSAKCGWPEGWAGARSTARAARRDGHEEIANKLDALVQRLEPKSLADRVAAFVSPEQWSALDIAEIELEDEKKYEKAQKHVEAKCREIGKELADDVEALKTLLPAISTAKGNRGLIVADELGRQTSDVDGTWGVIVGQILSPQYKQQLSSFPAWFISGVAKKSPEKAEELLDVALADVRLHDLFVHMQAVHGVNEKGYERLHKAVRLNSVPVASFGNLAYGRPWENRSGGAFKSLLIELSKRDKGLDVALDILSMTVFTRNADKQLISAPEKQTGRELLARVTFDKRDQRDDYHLAQLVTGCLVAPEDEPIARQMCVSLMDAIADMRVYAWDYPKVVSALAVLFPRAVLDILVENGNYGYENRRSVFSMFRERQPCPLRKVDADSLIEWAKEAPDTRFVKLAEAIRLWVPPNAETSDDDDADETAPLSWNPVVLRILREAPQPIDIFSVILSRVRPSGWSGSLATILSNRLPLIELLQDDADPAVASAAKKAAAALGVEIDNIRKREAERDRDRDERFEW